MLPAFTSACNARLFPEPFCAIHWAWGSLKNMHQHPPQAPRSPKSFSRSGQRLAVSGTIVNPGLGVRPRACCPETRRMWAIQVKDQCYWLLLQLAMLLSRQGSSLSISIFVSLPIRILISVLLQRGGRGGQIPHFWSMPARSTPLNQDVNEMSANKGLCLAPTPSNRMRCSPSSLLLLLAPLMLPTWKLQQC